MINSNLCVQNTTGKWQNIVLIVENPQNGGKLPKGLPNILRNSVTHQPTVQSSSGAKKVVQTDNHVASENTNNFALSTHDDNPQTYVLDQTEFASLPLQSIESKGCTTSSANVEEILITGNQVHVLNEPIVTSCKVVNSVCRTCLMLVPVEKSKKLFDSKNKDESNSLRKKISYIAENIDLTASIDPVICSKCLTLIDIAIGFKKRVTEIEKRIQEKTHKVGHVKTMVNLRSLIGLMPTTSDGGENTPVITVNGHSNIPNEIKVEEIAVDTGRSDGITIKNQPCEPLEENQVNQETVVIKILSEEIAKEKPSPRQRQKNYRSLDIADSNADSPNRSNILGFNGNLKVNSYDVNPAFRSTLTPEPDVKLTDVKLTRSSPHQKVVGVERLIRAFPSTNLFTDITFKVKKANAGLKIGRKWMVLKEGEQFPQTAASAATDGCPMDTDANGDNLPPKRKKKPVVPDTFDLFDEEHDRYFADLDGEPGWLMLNKWKKYRRMQPDYGYGPYLCEFCALVMENRAKFQSHVHKHYDNMKMCSYCGQFFHSSQKLYMHVMTKHKPPTFQCTHCGKMFHLSHLLANHVAAVHTKSQKRYQCHECGKVVSYSCLKLHNDLHRSKTYPCNICDKVFNARSTLFRHKRAHSRRYQCELCSSSYNSGTSLKVHVERVHDGVQWQCTLCNKLLARKENLVQHYRAVHGLQSSEEENPKETEEGNSDQNNIEEEVNEENTSSARDLYENFTGEIDENVEEEITYENFEALEEVVEYCQNNL